jgi:hypothetical protein
MSGKRIFTGSRAANSLGEAAKIKKMELMKGGKLPLTSADRYKRIMDKKVEEHRAKANLTAQSGFMLKGATSTASYKRSKRAEQALKEMAKRKAIKAEKELRQMIVIKPRRYYDGQGYFAKIDAKGNVYDETDNIVLRVDARRGGVVKTMGGLALGKYKPKRAMHVGMMRDWVNKHSIYLIKLRQMEMQRQIQAMYAMQGIENITIHGIEMSAKDLARQIVLDAHGNNTNPAAAEEWQRKHGRDNLGVNAWGVMSNNVHGTFGENVWGTFSDNVWGSASNNIWGGIGDPGGWGKSSSGGIFGKPGRSVWGSGRANQKNYIKIGVGMVLARLGFFRRSGSGRPAGGRSGGGAPAPRSGGRR